MSEFNVLSRVLRDSVSHFSVGPSVRLSVSRSVGHKTVLKVFEAFFMSLNGRKETLWNKWPFQMSF